MSRSRIVMVLDCDDEDDLELKRVLEAAYRMDLKPAFEDLDLVGVFKIQEATP